MYRAVHADRAGRVFVSADDIAAAYDGASVVALSEALPLTPDVRILPLDREAEGLDRSGRPRRLGAGRFAVAALLPPGQLRTHFPAYADAPGQADLAPRSFTAVAADEGGSLVAAAVQLDRDPTHDADAYLRSDLAATVSETLRQRPSSLLLRQLARCAREWGCHAAANAFFGRWECALPIAAPANERPSHALAPRFDGEAEPREPAAFHPAVADIATLATAHIAAGGTLVSFGRACEGEPLLAARIVEDAIARIRGATGAGTIHLETNGSLPGALRRLATAGLDSVCIRLASARPNTYDALHRPEGYRPSDVRASLRVAAEQRLSVSLLLLVLPGVFDRPEEIDALVSLGGDLPDGSALLLRDFAADPLRALALLPAGEAPIGVARAVERLRHEMPHVRIGAFVRPLARI